MNELSLTSTTHHHHRKHHQHNPQLMEVVQDYFPCSAMELPVREGEIVEYIQSEGVWMYVRTENGADGYIPRRHCRLIDPSEIPDLGYYSDQYRYEDHQESRTFDYHNNTNRHQQQPQRAQQQHQIHASFKSNYERRNTPILRVSRLRDRSSFSSTGSSSSSQHQQQPSERVIDGNNGLYTKGRSDSNLHFDTTSRPSRGNTVNDAKSSVTPVCGRKCGSNCEHKVAARKSRADSNLSARGRQAKTPSIVSESSGKSFKEDASSTPVTVDENNNNNNNNNVNDSLDHPDETIESPHDQQRGEFELPQTKCGHPELIIIKKYEKKSATDISVDSGDYATIINDTKYEDWMYIVNETGQRGFIPKMCAIKHECNGMFHILQGSLNHILLSKQCFFCNN